MLRKDGGFVSVFFFIKKEKTIFTVDRKHLNLTLV